jgi:hypothetical protein
MVDFVMAMMKVRLIGFQNSMYNRKSRVDEYVMVPLELDLTTVPGTLRAGMRDFGATPVTKKVIRGQIPQLPTIEAQRYGEKSEAFPVHEAGVQ